jgi:hypothetical protein
MGRSGLLPHLLLFLLFLPPVSFGARFWQERGVILSAPFATTFVLTIILALIGGVRRRKSVLPLAFGSALAMALTPIGISLAFHGALDEVHRVTSPLVAAALTLVAAVLASAWLFGAYLSLLTRAGFEHTQAFTALDHPGYKHFVRLRVHADGRRIDGWCLGLVDPLGPGQKPVLVDAFTWRPAPGTSVP